VTGWKILAAFILGFVAAFSLGIAAIVLLDMYVFPLG